MSVEVCHDDVVEALREAGAVFALVFGSRARCDLRGDSDLDIGAWWEHDAPAVWDVAVPDGVDLAVLNTTPLELAGRIALEGVVLFDDDPPARVHWVADTRKIWLDERPRFERAHRDFIEASTWSMRVESFGCCVVSPSERGDCGLPTNRNHTREVTSGSMASSICWSPVRRGR